MQVTKNPNHISQGFHLNWQTRPVMEDCPRWTSQYQREKWQKEGLILWDEETQQVTNISGHQALNLLDKLRHTVNWQEQGCVVGEPTWCIPFDNSEHKEKLVLTNKIDLAPQQAQAFFDFLVSEEEYLRQMKAWEEQNSRRILNQVWDLLIEFAERGKHTIYDGSLSWAENKKIMRAHWDSGNLPHSLTITEQRLWREVLKEKQVEYESEKRKAKERELRIKKNLLSHHFFWERIKPLWLYLKANERLYILQRLQDTEWNQSIVNEIKQIIENAQFFEKIESKIGSSQATDKISSEEMDLLLKLDDDELWLDLLDLYKRNPTAAAPKE